MPRTFTTQDIVDANIEQIIITKTKDEDGNPEVRVRASVSVKLVDNIDPLRTSIITLNLNKTIQQLGIGQQVNQIRLAVLNELKTQIQ